MEYSISYFIDKFSKIPNRMWTTGSDGWLGIEGKYCADGFCGGKGDLRLTGESLALAKLLLPLVKDCSLLEVNWHINDGHCKEYSKNDYLEPKERILAALHDRKIMEANIKEAGDLVNKKYVSLAKI